MRAATRLQGWCAYSPLTDSDAQVFYRLGDALGKK